MAYALCWAVSKRHLGDAVITGFSFWVALRWSGVGSFQLNYSTLINTFHLNKNEEEPMEDDLKKKKKKDYSQTLENSERKIF